MCIFSQPVVHVGATKIFARLEGTEQVLIYEMAFAASGTLAMVLPLPVPPAPPEDAVRFVDLSGYPSLFADLDRLFPEMLSVHGGPGSPQPQAASRATLVVHDVGELEASFVPRLEDFRRLDARFRLSDRIWRALPAYRDHGFAVFKLKGGEVGWLARLGLARATATHRRVHPMALRFRTRAPDALFFPTVHVHDGQVRPRARFDHDLYCQSATTPRPPLGGFSASHLPVDSIVKLERAQGLVDATLPVQRMQIRGELANEDIVANV